MTQENHSKVLQFLIDNGSVTTSELFSYLSDTIKLSKEQSLNALNEMLESPLTLYDGEYITII